MGLMRLRVSIMVCRGACAARVARFCAICPFKGPPRKCAPSPRPRSDRDFTADDYEALRALDEGLDSRRGAPRDLIRSLPVERLPSGGGAAAACEALGRCVVCLEEFKPGGRLKRLPCGHAFHARCIDRWLRTKAVCPVCQQGIAPETAENDH